MTLSKRVRVKAVVNGQKVAYVEGDIIQLWGVEGMIVRILNRFAVEVEWNDHTDADIEPYQHLAAEAIPVDRNLRVLKLELVSYEPQWSVSVDNMPTAVVVGFREESNDPMVLKGTLPTGFTMHDLNRIFNEHASRWSKGRERHVNQTLESIRDYDDPSLQR